jgi:hypothetical protein
VYPSPKAQFSDYNPIMSYGFVRLQDLNLSYIFRQQFLKGHGIQNLRVYLSAKNLFTLTGWTTGDPENRMAMSGINNLNTYPLQKTFSFGINVSF